MTTYVEYRIVCDPSIRGKREIIEEMMFIGLPDGPITSPSDAAQGLMYHVGQGCKAHLEVRTVTTETSDWGRAEVTTV